MYNIFTSADGFLYYLQGYDCLLNIESLEKKLIHVEEQERFVLTSICNTIIIIIIFIIIIIIIFIIIVIIIINTNTIIEVVCTLFIN